MNPQTNYFPKTKSEDNIKSYQQILSAYKNSSFKRELEDLGFTKITFSLSKKEDNLSLRASLPYGTPLAASFNSSNYRYLFMHKDKTSSYSSDESKDATTTFIDQIKEQIVISNEERREASKKNHNVVPFQIRRFLKKTPEATSNLTHDIYLLLRYISEREQINKPKSIEIQDTSFLVLKSEDRTYDFNSIEHNNQLVEEKVQEIKYLAPYCIEYGTEIEKEVNKLIQLDW